MVSVVVGYLGPMSKVFLSHNFHDKGFAEGLAAALQLLGVEVWYDSWKVRPGDSLPYEINKGLQESDIFCLLWSENAARSRWVETELGAAQVKMVKDRNARIIPVVLDETAMPPLISHLLYVKVDGRKPLVVAREMLGLNKDSDMRLAIQRVLDSAGVQAEEFWGVGLLVCCPKCGADLGLVEGWHAPDYDNDRAYAGARCMVCDWNDGSET